MIDGTYIRPFGNVVVFVASHAVSPYLLLDEDPSYGGHLAGVSSPNHLEESCFALRSGFTEVPRSGLAVFVELQECNDCILIVFVRVVEAGKDGVSEVLSGVPRKNPYNLLFDHGRRHL